MQPRRLLISVILLAILGSAVSTSAQSAGIIDRELTVDVVGDDKAALGIAQNVVATNGTANLTITVTNRLAGTHPLTVDVTVNSKSGQIGTNHGLRPGTNGSLSFTRVACQARIAIHAIGGSVDIKLTRTVDC